MIETPDFLTKVLGTPNKLAQTLRNAIIPMVSHLAPFQHAFVQRLSELGIAYHGSPIIEGPGKRYFDDSLRGGSGIRSRFLLFFDNAADSTAKKLAAQLVGQFTEIAEVRFSPRKGITLVRPDGYIAYSAETRDSITALNSVRLLLERQTLRPSQARPSTQVA